VKKLSIAQYITVVQSITICKEGVSARSILKLCFANVFRGALYSKIDY